MDGVIVSEAAQRTGWSARMLRYVERVGLVVPRRTPSGYRLYGLRELNQLRSLAELRRRFRVERFEDHLEVTEVEPVLAYIRSSNTYRNQDLGSARRTVEAALAHDGVFRIAKCHGVITARKP